MSEIIIRQSCLGRQRLNEGTHKGFKYKSKEAYKERKLSLEKFQCQIQTVLNTHKHFIKALVINEQREIDYISAAENDAF
jgi:hypothetical protein